MTLEITIEKGDVVYIQPGLWEINIHLTGMDGEIVGINKDYSANFRKGDSFDSKAKEIIGLMQTDIDKYYSEVFIYSDYDIDNLVKTIEVELNLEEPTELDEVRKKNKLIAAKLMEK